MEGGSSRQNRRNEEPSSYLCYVRDVCPSGNIEQDVANTCSKLRGEALSWKPMKLLAELVFEAKRVNTLSVNKNQEREASVCWGVCVCVVTLQKMAREGSHVPFQRKRECIKERRQKASGCRPSQPELGR